MRPEIVIAVMSAVVSLISVVITALITYRTTVVAHRLQERTHERTKAELAEELFRRYREPLLRSAQSLQSRLFNGINRGFLHRYLNCGDSEDEHYVRYNTVYVLAEYLGWLEILRRDQRFLDVRAMKSTSELFTIIERTLHALATDSLQGPFRLFRGQQRAVGEVMLTHVESSGSTVNDVLGYAAYCARIDADSGFARWFGRLLDEVDAVESEGHSGNQRLIHLQNALIDLIDLLDPHGDRLPMEGRVRLPMERVRVPAPMAVGD
jgi:hypothetical protein